MAKINLTQTFQYFLENLTEAAQPPFKRITLVPEYNPDDSLNIKKEKLYTDRFNKDIMKIINNNVDCGKIILYPIFLELLTELSNSNATSVIVDIYYIDDFEAFNDRSSDHSELSNVELSNIVCEYYSFDCMDVPKKWNKIPSSLNVVVTTQK